MRDLINQGIEAILPVYIENRGNSTSSIPGTRKTS